MTTPWEQRYAQRTQRMGSSAIRELLKLTERPDIISFGGGLPAPELFPVEEFKVAADKVLTQHGKQALPWDLLLRILSREILQNRYTNTMQKILVPVVDFLSLYY